MLRHIKDYVVPELQLVERLYRLMIAAETVDNQRRLAARSGMANGFRGLAAVRQRRSYFPSPLEKSGTERFEEAVAAYPASLEEYTRERDPLEWERTWTHCEC